MSSQRWYLLSLFVIVCLLSFLANGMDGGSTSVMAQTVPPPPSNDYFADATEINTLPYTEIVDIGAATLEPGEPQGCYMSRSIWYRYQPSANVILHVDLDGSNFGDPALTVWQGVTPGGLTYISCTGWGGSVEFAASAGQTYYIQAGRQYDEAWGEVHLNVVQLPALPNDAFATAMQVQGLPFHNSQETRWATTEAGEPTPSCAWSVVGGTVWYAYTPVANGSLYAYVDANFSPVFAVYTGSSLASLSERGCRSWNNPSNRLAFAVQAGTTYYFQVGSLYSNGGSMTFNLDVAPPPQVTFSYNPSDPSIFDTINFSDNSQDPYGGGIQSQSWNFGDGATATGIYPIHRYAADGTYAVMLRVTTYDSRTASTTQNVTVKTHDVAITKFSAPNSASAGQTRALVVGLNSKRYDETVEVRLLKSNPGDPWNPWVTVGTLSQFVPVRPSNRTTDFNFSYTFTPDDAKIGKVSFKAVATLLAGRDALPADNEASAPPTKVGGKTAVSSGSTESTGQNVQIFLPIVASE